MCLSKAYIAKNGENQLLIENVSSVRLEDGRILLNTLFGEHEEIKAEIKEIDFMTHRILLEEAV
ncbi:MAG: CooT family nickel-binding protein [Dehalococcoidales bacterium]|jgi:predicted RNA-binding protein|nr:CooT family nickel-binding protein [Dehalococcoidales bacterium]